MALAEELQKLAELRAGGALSEEEFQTAKRRLLDEDARPRFSDAGECRRSDLADLLHVGEDAADDYSLGRAANRYVSLQTFMAIIGLLVFLIVGLPLMCNVTSHMQSFPTGGPTRIMEFPRGADK
jgi:hypothetical protein